MSSNTQRRLLCKKKRAFSNQIVHLMRISKLVPILFKANNFKVNKMF